MSEEITSQDAQYALDIVKKVCAEVGPGLPGTPQERERAEMIKKELEVHIGADKVVLEDFVLAPGAFLDSQLISTLCMMIAVLLNISMGWFANLPPWVTATLALVFSLSAVLLFIFEFVIGFEVVDRFFKKKESVNVIGTIRNAEPQNVQRLLLLSGHHDSAMEFTWLRFTGYGFFILLATWVIGLLAVLVMSIIQLTGAVVGNEDLVRHGTLRWALLVYPLLPAIICAMFFTRGRKNGGIVPGAADNLSACGLVVAMCRFLVQNPSRIPADTEIRFITFGSEEAGVRGSRRYVQRHLEELQRLDARLLNFETIVDPEIAILTSEVNGTVKNSPAMVNSLVAAAQRAGVPYRLQPATLGTSNDAGRFSQVGLKAATLLGFNTQQMVTFYHQERDTPEILAVEPLLNVLRLALEWVANSGE
ncbi:MAG: M28 family metallopeptidase [Anaerolineales bacterium]